LNEDKATRYHRLRRRASLLAAASWHRRALPSCLALKTTFAVSLPDDVHTKPVREWVREVAAGIDRTPYPGRVTADPDTLEVIVDPPTDGERVLREDAVDLVREAIRTPGAERLPLPVEHLPQQVADEDVERVAAQVARALEEPLVLDLAGEELALEPEEIARLVDTRPVWDGDRLTLAIAVRDSTVEEIFEPYRDVTHNDPVDARFEVRGGLHTFNDLASTTWTPREADVEIIPSEPGTQLDPVSTARQLSDVLASGDREARLELEPVRAAFTTADARDLNVTHLIGTFTTHHACCQGRVQNIQRMADIVRGAIILPDETFSLNGHVGRRTRARGFTEGGTILRGEFIDEVGGGVSQFATTMYNAAFFAGIDILEWQAHSYYISRYPRGREATVYYPIVDLKIRNTTENAILVHTSYTPTSITVSLFGDNGGLSVRAEHGQPFNFRTADEIVREDRSLEPGTERVVQGSAQGFDVVVNRHMTTPDGETRSERIFTRYEAQPRIVERNSEEPEPDPTPTPTPDNGNGD
jgi:vancomycin resistance protein YoaR